MPESAGAGPDREARAAWPDLPLVVEQLQDQIDALRAIVEAQQRQIAAHQARLDALDRK